MELVSLSLYTIDVKGGKILEINDGSASDIITLDKEYDGDFIEAVVVPEIRRRLPERQTVYSRPIDDIGSVVADYLQSHSEDWNGLIISGFSRGGTIGLAPFPHHRAVVANELATDVALFRNKALFSHLASQIAIQSIPKTELYDVADRSQDHIRSLAENIKRDFADIETLVIKPINAEQGKGVVIVKRDDILKELKYLLDEVPRSGSRNIYGDSGFAESYWADQKPSLFQVQQFVENEPTIHKGKTWDGTNRYVCATISQRDEAGEIHTETIAFGGFVKLPRAPVSANVIDQKSRISFSYPYNLLERLARRFGFAAEGSGDQVLLPQEIVQQDTTQITADLSALFHHIHTMDIGEYLADLRASRNPALQDLGRELAPLSSDRQTLSPSEPVFKLLEHP